MARQSDPVTIDYTNYRGERAIRTITPHSVEWGSNCFHREPQWILTAFDHGKKACRTFALRDIHSWDGEPTELDRPFARSEPRTQEQILAALDPIRIGAPAIPPGFVLVPGERIAELEVENERLKREADGPFARALKDVMSAYPGFEWHDYPDGITADDIREFFRSDLDETWRVFDASKARIAELEAQLADTDALRRQIETIATQIVERSERISELEEENKRLRTALSYALGES